MDKKDKEIKKLQKEVNDKFHLLMEATGEKREIIVFVQEINSLIDGINESALSPESKKDIIEQLSMAISDKIGMW